MQPCFCDKIHLHARWILVQRRSYMLGGYFLLVHQLLAAIFENWALKIDVGIMIYIVREANEIVFHSNFMLCVEVKLVIP